MEADQLSQYQVWRNDSEVVIERLRVADTHWKKLKGLMWDTSLQPDEALWLARCNSIHCCFMKMDIDVLFLDKSGTVLRIMEEMRPWRFSPIVRKADAVIECYPGTVRRLALCAGDRLTVKAR